MGPQGGRVVWPARSGVMPVPVDGFDARAEDTASLAAALVAGVTVVLAPAPAAGQGPGGWREPCGKTQLAVRVAESVWRSGGLELLVWITASSRASVLSGYAEAAVAAMGADPEGDAEAAAERFAGWLGRAHQPWLVVLDDLRTVADLRAPPATGPAGQ